MKRIILLIGIVLLNILIFNYLYNNLLISKKFINTLNDSKYILYGLGSIDNNTYTNSIDALNENSNYKIFEVDVSLTKDDKLVLASGWNLTDYKRSIGIKYYNDTKNNVKDTNTPTYDEFMNFLIQDKYKATSYNELIKYMKKNKDTYFYLDIGNGNDVSIKKRLDNIIKNTPKYLLKRVIIHTYNKEMLDIVKSYNSFKLINMFYNKNEFENIDEFIKLCENEKITTVTTTLSSVDKNIIKKFKDNNIVLIVTDIEDKNIDTMLRNIGIDIIGSYNLK